MKKILIPTDFSSFAGIAFKTASSIARKSDAEIVLLHVLDLPKRANDQIVGGHSTMEVVVYKNAAEKKMKEIVASLESIGLKVSYCLKLEQGNNDIVDYASESDIDLIVMGSHGTSGFKELFVGSNTQMVVRNSEIPVLVIKEDISDLRDNNKIVIASDFNPNVKDSFLRFLDLYGVIGGELHLLNVNTPNNFKTDYVMEDQLNAFLEGVDIGDYTFKIYNDFSVEKGVLNYTEKIEANLIGLFTHGRKGISRFISGSITEDLVNHSPKNILTLKIN